MKTMGFLGGMSWESTVTYYRVANETVKETLGGLHSAKCVLYSVDFQELEECLARGDWDRIGVTLSAAAKTLEGAGADFVVICTNTMHNVAEAVQTSIGVPLLHIADMTADELQRRNIHKVALLGTKYTMEKDFYKSRLIGRGLEVVIPETADRERLNAIVFEELCLGKATEASRAFLLDLVNRLAASGAEGTILGCTELGLLISEKDTAHPLFDTALIHARGAALYALGKADSRAC